MPQKPTASKAARRVAGEQSALIANIAFLMYGSASANAKRKLRKEMLAHRDLKGKPSRQAVAAWFDNDSIPSRGPALELVRDFFETKVRLDALTENRKKTLHAAVQVFFRRLTESAEADNKSPREEEEIYTTKSGVLIPYKMDASNLAHLEKALGGHFLAYHYRFNEDDPQRPIARETLHVFRRDTELRFDLWYRREDASVERFRGLILPVGHLLWFLGSTEKPPPRLRIMHFRHTKTFNEKHNSLWWGIVSSDTPTSGPDAASARVCLIKQRTSLDMPTSPTPGYLSIADFRTEQHSRFLERMISNKQTALSKGHTITPEEIDDMVLRVNQLTAERTSDAIFDQVDWAKNAELPGEKQ
jgi:hypothetical protein